MTLQSSGAISFANLQGEFGGSNPISISEYYRNAGLVPNTGTNAGIPTSGQISLSQFYGSSASTVSVGITSRTVEATGSGTQTATYSLLNNGSNGYAGQWMNPNPQATTLTDDYEVLATVTGGTLTSGTAGSWLNLGTTRSWVRNRTTAGTSSCTIQLQIRLAGTSTDITVANITLSATVESSTCVTADSWMDDERTAEEVEVGDYYQTHLPEEGLHLWAIEAIGKHSDCECVRIVTESGASLKCSKYTPFNLPGATTDLEKWVSAVDLLDEQVMVTHNGAEPVWERVIVVQDIGVQTVVPISFGGRSYPAGEYKESLIYSHNTTKVIP